MVAEVPSRALSASIYAAHAEVVNKMNPDHFDRYGMPLLSWLQKRKRARTFTQGKYIQKLAENGGLDLQFFDRGDVLDFNETFLDNEMYWSPHKAHMGLKVYHSDIEDRGFTVVPNSARGRDFPSRIPKAAGDILVDYFKEQIEDMMHSYDERYDQLYWRDGTSATGAPDGMDALLPLDNTSGTIGGQSRADVQFRHYVATGSTYAAAGTIERDCNHGIRQAETWGGSRGYRIDTIFAGDGWIDRYVKFAVANGLRYQTQAGSPTKVDMGIPDSGVAFNNIPVVRVPTFSVLDALGAYSGTPWSRRAYFLSSKAWELSYQHGKDKVFSAPPDPGDQRLTRLSLDGRYVLACRFPRAQFVNTVAS
jgi:hypothetical protein